MPRGFLPFVCLTALLTFPASAIDSRPRPDARQIDPSIAAGRAETLDPASDDPPARNARGFLQRRGGQWRFSIDSRTGLATLLP